MLERGDEREGVVGDDWNAVSYNSRQIPLHTQTEDLQATLQHQCHRDIDYHWRLLNNSSQWRLALVSLAVYIRLQGWLPLFVYMGMHVWSSLLIFSFGLLHFSSLMTRHGTIGIVVPILSNPQVHPQDQFPSLDDEVVLIVTIEWYILPQIFKVWWFYLTWFLTQNQVQCTLW